jgi:hypothetical protein
VVFALIGSFVLSRTLVSTMAFYLLHGSRGHHGGAGDSPPEHAVPAARTRMRNPLVRFQQRFETRFAQVREH